MPPRIYVYKNAPAGTGITRGEQYVYTDITNKVIGPMNTTPVPVTGLSLFPENASNQMYEKDYTVRQVSGGSAPGYYICVAPTSSAPGGGAFVGGSNPSVGVDPPLAENDQVRVIYPA